jgi:hypothetical protein
VELLPYVWPIAFEEPIVLYEGGLRLRFGAETLDGVGQVLLQWRPSPSVRYRFRSGDGGAVGTFFRGHDSDLTAVEPLELAGMLPRLPSAAVALPIAELGRDDNTLSREGDCPRQEFGDREQAVSRMIFHLINFVSDSLPEAIEEAHLAYLGRLTLTSDHWQVTIERPDDASGPFDDLDRLGGYAFTHVVELRRRDGSEFTVGDTVAVEDALFHLLGFARAALIGLALPVAYSTSGEPVWLAWRVTSVEYWRNSLNWCDSKHIHELSPLFNSWLKRTEDPFWRDILRRAVRECLTANVPKPLETAIAVSHGTLELLAWAVLVVDKQWLNPNDGKLAVAGRMRLLLRWAGIKTAIDPRLTALQALAKTENLPDGPKALAYVRNRIVHPPGKQPDGKPMWLSHDELTDSWRLGLEYAELVILRILDHSGHYGGRFHMEGRWPGEVSRVPWASGTQEGEAGQVP